MTMAATMSAPITVTVLIAILTTLSPSLSRALAPQSPTAAKRRGSGAADLRRARLLLGLLGFAASSF